MEWIGCGILFAIIMIWYRIEKGGDGIQQWQREQLVVLRDIYSRLEEIKKHIGRAADDAERVANVIDPEHRRKSDFFTYREPGAAAADPADPERDAAAIRRELEELLRRKQT
jgi:hypothetical protein